MRECDLLQSGQNDQQITSGPSDLIGLEADKIVEYTNKLQRLNEILSRAITRKELGF